MKIVLSILLLLLVIGIASAETGSFGVGTGGIKFNVDHGDGGLPGLVPSNDTFFFDFEHYNRIYNWTMSGASGAFGTTGTTHLFEYTTFQIISGGTGGGIFSYDSQLKQLDWICNPSCQITSDRFTVDYDHDEIFQNFTYGNNAAGSSQNSTPLTTANPLAMSFNTSIYKMVSGWATAGGHKVWTYSGVVESEAIIQYTIGYPLTDRFSATITKSGTVTSKVKFENLSRVVYYSEPNFNTNTFAVLVQWSHGIAINATLDIGGGNQYWDRVVINYTTAGAQYNQPHFDINSNGSGIVNYSQAVTDFEYDNVFNNSPIRNTYGIRFLSNRSDFDTNVYPSLQYYITVRDPAGLPVKTEFISLQCTQTERPWWDAFGLWTSVSWQCVTFGAQAFIMDPPIGNWTNGTYSTTLYEKYFDKLSALDVDYVNVWNQTGFTGTTGGTTGGTNEGTVNSWGILSGACAAGSPVCFVDGWTSLLGLGVNDQSRFLFALMIIMLSMVIGFLLTGNNTNGGIMIGFVPFAWFAYIAYTPTWFTVLLILILGIKLGWFR